jgi:hypothetical protein
MRPLALVLLDKQQGDETYPFRTWNNVYKKMEVTQQKQVE